MSMARRPKRRRYDLREYWPWYERNWPTADAGYGLPSTTPPPFGLGKILERVSAFMSSTDDLLVTVNNAYGESGRPSREIKPLRDWKAGLAK